MHYILHSILYTLYSIYSTLLYHTMLCYTIQYHTIPYHTILCHTIILYYTILYYTILYYTILYCTILYYTILYYTILYYTILYYTILYTIYYILYTIYYILYTIYYILYTIYYILYTIYYILYTTYYILYTIYYILYTILYYTITYHIKSHTLKDPYAYLVSWAPNAMPETGLPPRSRASDYSCACSDRRHEPEGSPQRLPCELRSIKRGAPKGHGSKRRTLVGSIKKHHRIPCPSNDYLSTINCLSGLAIIVW